MRRFPTDAIQLGTNQRCIRCFGMSQSLFQLGTIIAFARLDFDVSTAEQN
jgi:hypothetical protein